MRNGASCLPRLTAALCIVFFVAVFGIAAYRIGAFVWVAFVPVTLCGVVNLWLLTTGTWHKREEFPQPDEILSAEALPKGEAGC